MIGAADGLAGSVAVAALACLAAGNPPRRAIPLTAPAADGGGPSVGGRPLVLAAVVTAATVGALALAASVVLDGLGVGPPTARVAAGLVLATVALVQLAGGPPAAVPGVDQRGAALVPLTFPHLLRPEVVLVALSVGADHGALAVVLLAVPLGITVAAVAGGGGGVTRLLAPLGRLLAALGVLCGVDLVVDGVVAL